MVRVTFSLIAINVVVFFLQMAFGGFTDAFALTPEYAFSGAWWQFFTYMFLHGGFMHIGINIIQKSSTRKIKNMSHIIIAL